MFLEIAEILNRPRAVLIEDALGVFSLFALLIAGLALTGPL
jgi:hypothetical protein